jgi:hypothetical protein
MGVRFAIFIFALAAAHAPKYFDGAGYADRKQAHVDKSTRHNLLRAPPSC